VKPIQEAEFLKRHYPVKLGSEQNSITAIETDCKKHDSLQDFGLKNNHNHYLIHLKSEPL